MDPVRRPQNWGAAVLRIVVGAIFFIHGYQKFFVFGIPNVVHGFAGMGVPNPAVSAWLAALAELICGGLLILGLLTRWAAIPLAIDMLAAIFLVHLKGGFFLPAGFEYALTLLAANIALIFLGSGPLALDNLIRGKQKSER